MAIILQSTVGGFSAQFMRKLPLVEQEMREHGLDPAEFVISKDYASTATVNPRPSTFRGRTSTWADSNLQPASPTAQAGRNDGASAGTTCSPS